MSSDPLQRVRDDLATVKAALGTELPYDRSHVALYFLGSGLGLLLGGLTLFGLEVYVRAALFAWIALMFAAWMTQIRHLRARRVESPALWRWGRKEAIASVAAIVFVVAYVIWMAALGRREGRWGLPEAFALASSLFFCLGAAAVVWVVIDIRRWHLLGGAAALVGAGLFLPLCTTHRQFYLLLAAMIVAGGLSSGLSLAWQIRRHEVEHVH
jgi:hypothetical protein